MGAIYWWRISVGTFRRQVACVHCDIITHTNFSQLTHPISRCRKMFQDEGGAQVLVFCGFM